MATMRLSFQELVTRIADMVGDTNNSAPTGDDLTLATDIATRGLRRFLYPVDLRSNPPGIYEWSFMKQYHQLTTRSGVWQYPLPRNFSEITTDPVFGDEEDQIHLTQIPAEQLLGMRTGQLSSYPPSFYAIVPYGSGATTGTYDEIWFYPIPDATYQLKFFYQADPLKPEALTETLPGGVKAAEAIIECCLAVAEQQENDKVGIHTNLADKMVQQLIIADSARTDRVSLGNMCTGINRSFEGTSHNVVTVTWDLP
jgi:hypothetical protein